MNYEQLYPVHNTTMMSFAMRFNSIDDGINLMIMPNRYERFTNDGSIALTDQGLSVGYDWEHRNNGYDSVDEFEYKRYGISQYGTKLAKPSIKIALQESKDETGLLVVWHEDFKKDLVEVNLPSQTKKNRREPMGCTKYYTEYNITTDEGIAEFRQMLYRAFMAGEYNHTVF